jgi:GNAT superfamily N-acetyltransferase
LLVLPVNDNFAALQASGYREMSQEFVIFVLSDDWVERAARVFHDAWHETQAQLQDARIARYRDLAFFRNRVTQRLERTVIAISGGRCVGLAAWTGGMLNTLFVDRTMRGRGIGGSLCAEAEDQMKRGGAKSFWLECLHGNNNARAFYENHGWRVAGDCTLESQTPEGLCKVSAWKMVKP